MRYLAGTPVLISGSLDGRTRSGVVDEDYDGCGPVQVVLAGKTKPRPVDARRVRAAEPPRALAASASSRTRVVPVHGGPAAQLRAVPKPAPAARDEGYLAYVRAHACYSCTRPPPSQPHHWARRGRGGGTGTKPDDYRTIPLCESCHRTWHDTGALPGYSPAATRALALAWQVDLLVAWIVSGAGSSTSSRGGASR